MKTRCPDGCIYRPKDAPVCGFCLMKILQSLEHQKEEGEEDGQKSEDQSSGEAD